MTDISALQRLMTLYRGNARSYGQYDPTSGKMMTLRKAYSATDFTHHLDGVTGVGIVPIIDDGTCYWGAIDIDAHGDNEEPIDVLDLEQAVRSLDYPLVVCRSKGKGAHLYLYLADACPANEVRATLGFWAVKLGYPKAEIFPKQGQLNPDSKGERPLGSWINLPYFSSDMRTCVEGGQDITLEYFLDVAESRRLRLDDFRRSHAPEHSEAPPCIQRMMLNGVPKGEGLRNKALYAAAIYFKRAFSGDWQSRAFDFNNNTMAEPLPHREASTTIESVARRDYMYQCQEEPCLSLCDRKTCRTRKFGVGTLTADLPDMDRLIKYKAPDDSATWDLYVSGVNIRLSTEQLYAYNKLRLKIMESINAVPAMVKQPQWEDKLNELLKNKLEVIEIPAASTTEGLMFERLIEWLRRVNLTDLADGEADPEKRKGALQRGYPVPYTYKGEVYICWMQSHFISYLKRTKQEDLRGSMLAATLQRRGVNTQIRLRVGKSGTDVTTVYGLLASAVVPEKFAAYTPSHEL